jgi:hypothetical protein
MPNRFAQQKTVTAQLTVFAPYNGADRRDLGTFGKSSGFGSQADDIKYGEYPVATGVRHRDDATLSRPFSDLSAEEEAWLDANLGKAVTIIRSYAGDDGLPIGTPRTYTGRLKHVGPPDGDETSSGRSELTVMCILDSVAS